MRSLILRPQETLYTEDPTNPVTIRGALELLRELRQGKPIIKPVYVVRFPDLENRVAIFNGNRRTKAAELYGIPLAGLEIQSQADFQRAQADQPANWHKVEEEDYLKFNGEYFYKDLAALKNQGLLIPAYQRAKKRIKEAVRQFYQWL